MMIEIVKNTKKNPIFNTNFKRLPKISTMRRKISFVSQILKYSWMVLEEFS